MSSDKDVFISIPVVNQESSWSSFSLASILFFLQPMKALSHYNKLNNHVGLMDLPNVNYDILCPLQESPFSAFTDRIEQHIRAIMSSWIRNYKKVSFIKIIWQTFIEQWIYYIWIVQACVFTKMAVSYYLGRTLRLVSVYMATEDTSKEQFWTLFGYTTLLAVLLLLQVFIEQHYFQNIYQVSVRLRFALTGLLYRKLNSTTMTRIKDVSKGQIFNIISMDLMEIDSGLTWCIAFTGSIAVGVLGVLILYSYFQISALFGIATLLMITQIQRKILDLSINIKKNKNTAQDERTRLTGEVLQHIRLLKVNAIEKIYRDILVRKRSDQDNFGRKLILIDVLAQSLAGNLSVFLSLFFTIMAYVYLFEGVLSIDKVFGSLWVLQLIKVWCLTYFFRGKKFWININLLQQRIEEILNIKDLDGLGKIPEGVILPSKRTKKGSNIAIVDEENPSETDQINSKGVDDSNIKQDQVVSTFMVNKSKPFLIKIENYFGYWSKQDFQDKRFNLRNININLSSIDNTTDQGQLISIIGKIGSCKSTLLQAILQEIPYQTGTIQVKGSIAYVEQIPFIFPGTIQENITFGSAYNHKKYLWCLRASCLEKDLKNKTDQTQVGEKGSKLSGGQRARVSLARALYSDSSIVLLDDILSAVDTKVAQQIFHDGILAMKRQGRLVILVTHHIQWAALSDKVYLMDNGRIIQEAQDVTAIQALLNTNDLGDKISQYDEENSNYLKEENEGEEMKANVEVVDVIPPEIPIDVYKKYLNEAGGTRILVLIIITYLADSSMNLAINKYFGYWAQDHSQATTLFDHSTYLKIVGSLIGIYLVTSFVKLNLVFGRTLTAISNMHRKLCTSITRATVQYFNKTPLGTTLSRFTNDLNNIEGMVMLDCHWVLEGCIDNIFIIIIVSIQNIFIVLGAFSVLLWMFWVKKQFANFMKYAIKCDDLTRGELFGYIESSISGVTIIRAYDQGERLYSNFLAICYKNIQSYFTFLRLNALLGFTFELSLHLLIIFSLYVMILFEVGKNTTGDSNPSDVGFGLLMLLSLGYMFSLNLRGQIYLDIDMQNAYRVFQSIDTPQEGEVELDKDFELQLKQWPQKGQIEFQNVSVNYNRKILGATDQNQKEYALRNINIKIEAGESIGVIGRTGAGKSTLINCLFRMVDLEEGKILLDNIDIGSVGLHTIRERLSVIPQQAPLLCVSIRSNLDPKYEYQDQQIWNAMEKVGLADKVRGLKEQLNTIASPEMFSAGEKQLFCLCRILLHTNQKVLILDEATANMDLKTDGFVQQLIKTEFKQVTKILIAHRLQTVLDCDRVLVLDQGEIVEFDNPYTLLFEPSGIKGLKSMVEVLHPFQKEEIYKYVKECQSQKQNNAIDNFIGL